MTCKTAKTFNGTFGFIEIMQTELLVNYSTTKQSIVVETWLVIEKYHEKYHEYSLNNREKYFCWKFFCIGRGLFKVLSITSVEI